MLNLSSHICKVGLIIMCASQGYSEDKCDNVTYQNVIMLLISLAQYMG